MTRFGIHVPASGPARRARWLPAWISARWRFLVAFVLVAQLGPAEDPIVRIGIQRNVATFTIESDSPFIIEGRSVRSAGFSTVITLAATGDEVRESDLERRMAIDVGETVLVRPMGSDLEIEAGEAPFRVNGRSYRGRIEVRSSATAFTVINELPLEEYLLGVVPNELGPEAFPELEALKAQAVAARTYIVRNMGQFSSSGYDICATDQCQVYFGLDTEHEMATLAVNQTRGMIATYQGAPIEALYSSTCGGRTEDAENVFGNPVPYLVSTFCDYGHPEPQPFASTRIYTDWESGLLGIAGVDDFADAGRFLGIGDVSRAPGEDPELLASFVKEQFYPDIPTTSDRTFLEEQGILIPGGDNSPDRILARLLIAKNAFEWQTIRLIAWDGEVFEARVGSHVRQFRLADDAAIFRRVGEVRLPVDQGAWIGGESMEIRLDGGGALPEDREAVVEIAALVYRDNPAGTSADRYSPVARWQLHQTRDDLDASFESLGIGPIVDIAVLERGPSNRVVRARIEGERRGVEVTGPRLRTLLGIRDSLVYMDEERNSSGELLGMSFFGNGWGHGVGMCQVGAYGMARAGATFDEILKTYYRGIDVERAY